MTMGLKLSTDESIQKTQENCNHDNLYCQSVWLSVSLLVLVWSGVRVQQLFRQSETMYFEVEKNRETDASSLCTSSLRTPVLELMIEYNYNILI